MRKIYYYILSFISEVYTLIKPSGLRVLAYHTVNQPSAFEKQLQYLKKRYIIISLEQLNSHLYENKKLPKRSVLLTFDDGDISVLENGLPLLKRYGIPSVLFIITDIIGTNKPFWWDEISYHQNHKKDNVAVLSAKKIPNSQRIELIEVLKQNSGKGTLQSIQLTLNQLADLEMNEIKIANHSHTHPMFDQCEPEELDEELKKSKEFLSDQNYHWDVFAYPNGSFSDLSEKKLKDFDVKMAFLFDHKLNKSQINPLRISRLRTNTEDGLAEFKVKVSGLHSFLYHLRK